MKKVAGIIPKVHWERENTQKFQLYNTHFAYLTDLTPKGKKNRKLSCVFQSYRSFKSWNL